MVAAPRDRAAPARTVIRGGGLATLTDEDDPGAARCGPVGRYLYEPDGAVIRAGLVTAVAAGVGRRAGRRAHRLRHRRRARSRTPFARSYEVLEELPYQEKQLKAALRERGVGRLTIKKRGVDVVPERAAQAAVAARRRRRPRS